MKGKHIVLFLTVLGLSLLFFGASINAEECADEGVIEMKNTDAFDKHKMGIVMFDHKKHYNAEPDGYGIGCGKCHHDDSGQPLELKEGDSVQGCFECHSEPGNARKPADMSRDEWDVAKLDYYKEALHANCIDCHKEAGAGPVKCMECHPRPER